MSASGEGERGLEGVLRHDLMPNEEGFHLTRGRYGVYNLHGRSRQFNEVTIHVSDDSVEPPREVGSVRIRFIHDRALGLNGLKALIERDQKAQKPVLRQAN